MIKLKKKIDIHHDNDNLFLSVGEEFTESEFKNCSTSTASTTVRKVHK